MSQQNFGFLIYDSKVLITNFMSSAEPQILFSKQVCLLFHW